jgi:hypothetical protein
MAAKCRLRRGARRPSTDFGLDPDISHFVRSLARGWRPGGRSGAPAEQYQEAVRGDVDRIAHWENEMAERPLTSFFYVWFPDEFRFYVRYEIQTPGEDPSASKSRSLVSRSKGRPDFAVGIPAGWTDEDVMASLVAGNAFAMPTLEQGKWILYPPIEYFALVCGCPYLLSPSEMQQLWNTNAARRESAA